MLTLYLVANSIIMSRVICACNPLIAFQGHLAPLIWRCIFFNWLTKWNRWSFSLACLINKRAKTVPSLSTTQPIALHCFQLITPQLIDWTYFLYRILVNHCAQIVGWSFFCELFLIINCFWLFFSPIKGNWTPRRPLVISGINGYTSEIRRELRK